MSEYKKPYISGILLCALLLGAFPVAAQEIHHGNNIPIFDSGLAPLTSPALRETQEMPPAPKQYVRQREVADEIAAPPVPKRKPMMDIPVAIAKAPVPPKRPAVLNASQSFVNEARKDFQTQTPVQAMPDTITAAAPAQKLQQPEYIDITAPGVLDGELEQPSVRDVLSSIDPKADIPPEPQNLDYSQEMTDTAQSEIPKQITLGYLPGVSELPEDIREVLMGQLNIKRQHNPNTRIEVRAYASAVDSGQSSARRLSLSRALEIRDFLVEKNVNPKDIDIRALGNETEKEPVDRVDIIFADDAP